jgi:hypothetical protein
MLEARGVTIPTGGGNQLDLLLQTLSESQQHGRAAPTGVDSTLATLASSIGQEINGAGVAMNPEMTLTNDTDKVPQTGSIQGDSGIEIT